MATNLGNISNLLSTPTAQIDDGNDAIHSAIIMYLNAASGENRAISGFDITQDTTNSHTHYAVTAGSVLRNGKLVPVSSSTLTTSSSTGTSNSVDWYGVIVVQKSDDTLAWRHGTSSPTTTGKLDTSTATVAALTTGDIPIAVVKYAASSAADVTSRPIQFLGYKPLNASNEVTREFSTIDNGTEKLRLNKAGTLTYTPSSTAYTLTLPSATGTLARTADNITGTAAGLSSTLAVSSGGTGATSLTDGGILLGSGAGAITATSVLTNGQLLIGDGSGEPTVGTLTEGNDITITNGAGSITIASTDTQLSTTEVTGMALTNLDVSSGADITASDTILSALGKIENRVRLNDDKVTNTDVNVSNANLLTALNALESSGGAGDETINIGTDTGDTINFRGNASVAGSLSVTGDLTVTGTSTVVNTVTMNAQNAIVFEGATADANETILTITDPTNDDNTITLPDASGTVALTSSNVASATLAATVTVADSQNTAGTYYPTFVDGATGTQALETDTALTFNASTNVLSSTKFEASSAISTAERILVGKSTAFVGTGVGATTFTANALYNANAYYSNLRYPQMELKDTQYTEARLVVDAASESTSDGIEYYGTGAVYAIETQNNQHRAGLVLSHDEDTNVSNQDDDYTWGIGKQFSTAGTGTGLLQIGFVADKRYQDGFLSNDADSVFRADNSYLSISQTGIVTIPNQLKATKGITLGTSSVDEAGGLRYSSNVVQFYNGSSWTTLASTASSARTVTAGGNTLGASETLAFTAGTGITISENAGAVTITNSVTDTNTNIENTDLIAALGAESGIHPTADHLAFTDLTDDTTKKITLTQLMAATTASMIPSLPPSKVDPSIDSSTFSADAIPTLAQSKVTDLETDLAARVPTTRTIAGRALSNNLAIRVNTSTGKLEVTDGSNTTTIQDTAGTPADVVFDNRKTEYDEIQDANNTKPADNATVGARLGTNLKAADGSTTLGDADVKNASIVSNHVVGSGKLFTTTLPEDGATTGKLFFQGVNTGVPQAKSIGDLWFDSDNDNRMYIAASATANEITSGEWESIGFPAGEAGATANTINASSVTAAGALMDSELTSIADVKALDQSVISGASPTFSTANFTDASDKRLMTNAQESKLDSVESSADVTGTANVTAAGALMDSEVTNLAFVKGLASGISDGNVLVANANVADNDFLRVDGTSIEGRTVAEVRSDLSLGAAALKAVATDGSGGVADGEGGLVTGNAVFDYIAAQNFASSGASNFVAGDITGATDLGNNVASGDSLILHDTSASALREMTIANLTTYLNNASILTNLANTDTNTQNEYATSFVDSTNDIILRLTESGAGSGTQDIKFVAGSNITLTHTDANNITIASTDTNTNTNQLTTFTLTGDSGTNQTIAHGNTLDIAGGTGIDTVVGATDTVTVAIDNTVATLSGSQTLSNKTIAISQVTELSNLTAAEGEQLENIGSTTISATQWGYLGAATGAITNTDTTYSAGTNISLSGTTFNVDDAFLINNGDDTTTGTITAGGFTTAGSITLGGHAVDDIDIATEFVDSDNHLMTSAAIQDKILGYSYITASSSDTLTNKTIAASQVTEISNLTAAEGEQLENIGSTTISATQWGYLGAASGAITNTDVDVSVANLKARLADFTSADTVYIGDADDDTTIVIRGTLQVDGTTTTVNSTTVALDDHNIVLDKGNSTGAPVDGAGFTIEGGSGDDVTLQWLASGTKMELKQGSSYANFKAGTIEGAFTGNVTGNVTGSSGSTTGNAATATKIASITNSNIVQLTDSQTLTNKTISGSNNTLSNIGNGSLTNSAITIAGSSTSLGGSISADTIAGQISNATITNAQLAGSIANSKLANDGITIAGQDTSLGGTITADTIAGQISSGTITNAQLAGSISNDKLASGISATKLTTGTIPASRIGTGAISTTRLADDAVTNAKVGANAIDTTELANNAVESDQINANAVVEAKIADDAVTGAKVSGFAIANTQVGIGTLSIELGSSATTLTLSSSSEYDTFPATGVVLIGGETIKYTGKTGVSLTGLVRGHKGTSAATHSVNESVKTEHAKQITLGGSRTLEVKQFEGADSSNATDLAGGLVPYAGTGDTAKFLRGDGAWVALGGGSGTVTSVTAGTGMTQSGTNTVNPTLNVIGGDGITANADNVAITAAQTTITSVLNTGLVIGRDSTDQIKFSTDNQIIFRVGNADGVTFKASGEIEATSLDISGDADIDGTLEADAITIGGTAIAAAGTTSITTLGTIGTGTWQGTAIAQAYIADQAINEAKLQVSNAPTNGYVLTAQSGNTGGLTWAAASSGGASAIGDLSDAITTATSNIGLGSGALDSLTASSGNYNVALGIDAGTAITTGDYNTAIGYKALETINGETGIVAVGGYALQNADGGSGTLTTVGYKAGQDVTTAQQLVFVGNEAGANVTTGSFNTLVGNYSGRKITTGTQNTGLGTNALASQSASNMTGSNNVAVGTEALPDLTSGSANVSVGKNSSRQLTTGSYNIAIGMSALTNTTAVDYSIAIGQNTLASSSLTGAGNIAIGRYSGNDITTGTYNVIMGYEAGDVITQGAKNITIGYQAGDNITTGSNNVVIGAADVSSATGNSQLSISSGDGGVTWITGNSSGGINSKAEVVAVSSNTTLTLAQTGSYVYWTAGTLTLPASGTVGTQYTVINNTGGSATVAVNASNCSMVAGFTSATNATTAISDHELASFVCVTSNTWIQVG